MRWGFLKIAAGLLAGALLFPAQAEAVKVRRGTGDENHRSATVSAAAIEHVEVKDIPSRNASTPDAHSQTAKVEEPSLPLPPAQGRLEALIEHILKQESGMEESSVADMSASTEEQLQRDQIEEIMKAVAGVEATRSPFRTVPVPVAKRLL